jgi:hypothetical protein
MQTGVSTLIHDPGGRVQGVVVPNDPTNSQGNQGKTPPSPPKK